MLGAARAQTARAVLVARAGVRALIERQLGGVGGTLGGRGSATAGGSGGKVDRLGVLLFTRTESDRHDSIEAGVAALIALGLASNWSVQHLDEPDLISAKSLSSYEVLVLLNTSGDIFDDEQQRVLETYLGLGLGPEARM